jgi:hypothetical protein
MPMDQLCKLITQAIVLVNFVLFVVCSKGAYAVTECVTSFTTSVYPPKHQNTAVDYTIDPRSARYFIHVPANYTSSQAFGLVVYVSPSESLESLPDGWAEVLDRRRLLFICPQNAGNNCSDERIRLGLAVLGALEMMRNYNIDKSRTYAAGLSGGARVASDLGLVQNDIFCGTIQSCGSDFYRDVQRRYATTDKDTAGYHYGLCQATAGEINDARNKVKFVLITGSGDFRRGNILDIYYGGFAADRFRSKLIDLPEMGHQDCDGKTLEQALDFLR